MRPIPKSPKPHFDFYIGMTCMPLWPLAFGVFFFFFKNVQPYHLCFEPEKGPYNVLEETYEIPRVCEATGSYDSKTASLGHKATLLVSFWVLLFFSVFGRKHSISVVCRRIGPYFLHPKRLWRGLLTPSSYSPNILSIYAHSPPASFSGPGALRGPLFSLGMGPSRFSSTRLALTF